MSVRFCFSAQATAGVVGLKSSGLAVKSLIADRKSAIRVWSIVAFSEEEEEEEESSRAFSHSDFSRSRAAVDCRLWT